MSANVFLKMKSVVFSRYGFSQSCLNSAIPAAIGKIPKLKLPMFSEQSSGSKRRTAARRSSSAMPRPPPVVMFTTASVRSWIRPRNCAYTSGSGVGRPSAGSRAWRCRIAAPASAAPIAWSAICSGVIGRWGVSDGTWIAPVTAQLTIALRCLRAMAASLGPLGPRRPGRRVLGQLVERRLDVLHEQLHVADDRVGRHLGVVEDEHDVLGRQLLPLGDELVAHHLGRAVHPQPAVGDGLDDVGGV